MKLTRFFGMFLTLCAAGLLLQANAGAHNAAHQSESPMQFFSSGDFVDDASSKLVRTKKTITMTIHTNSLLPGGAYTNWWVLFNRPSACAANPCSLGDLGTPAVGASVVFATGHVVGGNGVGNFAAYITEGDTSGALFGPGLLDARGAEVHWIVRSHGPAIPALIHEQISTVGGACSINFCDDEQFSIHLP